MAGIIVKEIELSHLRRVFSVIGASSCEEAIQADGIPVLGSPIRKGRPELACWINSTIIPNSDRFEVVVKYMIPESPMTDNPAPCQPKIRQNEDTGSHPRRPLPRHRRRSHHPDRFLLPIEIDPLQNQRGSVG